MLHREQVLQDLAARQTDGQTADPANRQHRVYCKGVESGQQWRTSIAPCINCTHALVDEHSGRHFVQACTPSRPTACRPKMDATISVITLSSLSTACTAHKGQL